MYHEEDIIARWNAEMYDREETETADVAFALSVIGDAPKRILEIACGSGRFLIPLAQAGHDAMGLDFDEHMLSRISAKAADTRNLAWRQADVIREPWGTGFDVVLLAANFLFNITSDMDYAAAQALMIEKSADALVPGGHLLIDYAYTPHPETWFDDPDPHLIWEGTDHAGNFGKMILLDNTYDADTRIASCTRRFEMTLADGSTLVQELPSVKHFPSLAQVRAWLERYGFVVENEWGDYQGDPIGEHTNRAILWARKK